MGEVKCRNCHHFSGGQFGECRAPMPFFAESPRVYGEDGRDCPAHSANDSVPDLVEALQTLRDYVSDVSIGGLWVESLKNGEPCIVRISNDHVADDLARIDAAIAKAKGEQS